MIENNKNKKRYWKSLEELENQEKFNEIADKEFMSSPLAEGNDDGLARRDFVKLMGASLALASTACVRRPKQHIVPYVNRPHDVTPGEANYYASSVYDNGESFATIVKTREGRPIKLEGNPDSIINQGALSARMQAHVVSLYDPDRLKKPHKRIANDKDFHKRGWDQLSWEKLDEELSELIGNAKLGMLTASFPSSSIQRILRDFKNTFSAKHYIYDQANHEDVREGQKVSYGDNVFPRYRLDKAKYILSVGADFLGTYGDVVSQSKGFAKNRKPSKDMSKFVVFESLMSLTGMNADHRFRVKTSDYVKVLMGLAHEIVVKQGKSNYKSAERYLTKYANVASDLGIEADLFSQIAKDLWQNRGQSLVIAKSNADDAMSVQIAANFLNSILSNDGKTLDYKNNGDHFMGNSKDLDKLLQDIDSGKIDTLLVWGVNPIYLMPNNKKLKAALEKVTLIYSGQYMDETAQIADYVLAESHPLEEWGDWEFLDGYHCIQQPTIRPIAQTRAFPFNLMTWAYFLEKGPKQLSEFESWHDYVKWNWKTNIKGASGFDSFWVELLQKGFYDSKANQRERDFSARSFRTQALANIKSNESKERGAYELNLYKKIGIGDSDMANLPWMQEFPDPVSKVTWDNYLSLSYKTAKEQKLKDGDIVKLSVGKKTIEIPVFIQVGQEDSSLGLAIGYGRNFGKVAKDIGKNAYELVENSVKAALPAAFAKTGKSIEIACTQGHHHMEGRSIVVETTLKDYLKDPSSGIHKHKTFSIWPKHEYPGHKWGMSIDQNACIGCSACVIACQSENNIPVVGKKYVLEGREMHWIRIDRYYSGSSLHDDVTDNPDTYFQPQLCQHCDNAPCESVCPVIATSHSPEGINEMTYNRCVGTRYCANNCPYKSRRFNWFAFTKGDRDLDTPKEAYNPSVTVRSRGVMEKCSFCVHRIEEVKAEHKVNGTTYKDGDITTACEQSCPTDAIVFGDMNDPESRVAKLHKQKNSYKLLEEVHAEPSVRYLTKVRNKDSVSSGHHGGGH